VSNPIRYDSLLVRELAAELHGALAGTRLQAAILDRERLRLTLLTLPARRQPIAPPSLLWQLHPAAGHITAAHGAGGDAGRIPLRARSPIVAVSAPADERIIIMELAAGQAPPGAARRIIIELVANQWNVIATGADGRIVSVLRERATHGRELRTGALYAPPRRSARSGTRAPLTYTEWQDAVGPCRPEPGSVRCRAWWRGPGR
jgi:hypothetical protein